jgi:hypothetical protein
MWNGTKELNVLMLYDSDVRNIDFTPLDRFAKQTEPFKIACIRRCQEGDAVLRLNRVHRELPHAMLEFPVGSGRKRSVLMFATAAESCLRSSSEFANNVFLNCNVAPNWL